MPIVRVYALTTGCHHEHGFSGVFGSLDAAKSGREVYRNSSGRGPSLRVFEWVQKSNDSWELDTGNRDDHSCEDPAYIIAYDLEAEEVS